VSFAEAGGRREPFAAVQQLDFSGFTTAVHARANATKDLLNNADSLRDPFYYGSSQTGHHREIIDYCSSQRDPLLLTSQRALDQQGKNDLRISIADAWHPQKKL